MTESIDTLIDRFNKHMVLTFTGLHGVFLDQQRRDLGHGYYLTKPNSYLLSARSEYALNGRAYRESEKLSCFFALREELAESPNSEAIERLQDGLMAIQILKPVKTFGFIFQGRDDLEAEAFPLQRTAERPPMIPGEWSQQRTLDESFLDQVPDMIQRVTAAINSGNVEKKNAITLLQLSLEHFHFHPLVAGLLSVMGMEAVFDSENRNDFEKKLCDRLGAATLVFPDWNAPRSPAPKYTVKELAVPLYMLRNKLAHGADLRTAALDKSTPVDLIKKVQLTSDSEPGAFALLLSEGALYLLAQVLQATL
jgi:hypothetical protein